MMTFTFSLILQTGLLFPGQTGEALQQQIRAAYTPASLISYSRAQDSVFKALYWSGDSVECIYGGFRVFLDPQSDPSTTVYQNGAGLSVEHAWPQSKGAYGTGRSDLHHLFPAKQSINSARGNNPFCESPDNQTQTWYFRQYSQTVSPQTGADLWSERNGISGFFEPREQEKGRLARAMAYFYTIYRTDADAADTSFWGLQAETLLQWHRQFPPDAVEIARQTRIQSIQGNLNPFITDTSLFSRAYFSDGDQQTPTKPLLFFSEYVEGTSSNKYLEIVNAGSETVALGDIRVSLYSNGATTASNNFLLSGSLNPGEVLVLKNSLATLYTGKATIASSVVNFNGDDALSLTWITSGDTLDIFGRIGEDPGSAWISGDKSTLDRTLVRKSSVVKGIQTNPSSGFPTLGTEWDVYPTDTISDLGFHELDNGPTVPVQHGPLNWVIFGGQAEVAWTTYSESGNAGFWLEAQLEAHHWNPLAFLEGRGTSTDPNYYRLTSSFPDNCKRLRLSQVDLDGTRTVLGELAVSGNSGIIRDLSIVAAYPNPFNPTTTIVLAIPARQHIQLSVFSVTGQQVATLVNDSLSAGIHHIPWNASGLTSGTYLLKVNQHQKGIQVLLLK
ncbi:MAG: endonuclease [Bacteroidetes bacterium]|nr:endonuclease [Bacteroidota bacterium]